MANTSCSVCILSQLTSKNKHFSYKVKKPLASTQNILYKSKKGGSANEI
jgi:hypothetical protein